MSNLHYIHCDCGFHKTLTKEDDLFKIKTAPVPSGSPFLKDGKTVNKKPKPQAKKVKCPKCGRGVIVKKLKTPIKKADNENKPPRRKTGTFGREIQGDST
jgi:DNA-directed RNA polymerase subunit RPC12/RpoP